MTGSEVQRWGLGVVQEIDAAAMHVWARWQHQEPEALSDCNEAELPDFGNGVIQPRQVRSYQVDFDEWDLFQVGGVIFF